jgi:hypothetical protein
MTVMIEQDAADRILVLRFMDPIRRGEDATAAVQAVYAFKRQHTDPIVTIWDFQEAALTIEDVESGLSALPPVDDAFWRNQRSFIVGSAETTDMITEMMSRRFGGIDGRIPMRLLNSPRKALRRARQALYRMDRSA